eukprot:m.47986 g.47986  ORF g.47986 m.47986 type:complete len:499 (-) comp6947_c0_seq1:76-1572(-)
MRSLGTNMVILRRPLFTMVEACSVLLAAQSLVHASPNVDNPPHTSHTLTTTLHHLHPTNNHHQPAPTPMQLVWSDPVLVQGPTDAFPAGPPVPDGFHSFTHTAMMGIGTSGTVLLSSDSGTTWTEALGAPRLAHPGASVLPPEPAPNGEVMLRTVGGTLAQADSFGWTLSGAEVYTLWANESGVSVTPAPAPNVTFSHVPYPGVNTSSMVTPGRNYGVVKTADDMYVLQTDIVWNNQPGPFHTRGVTWSAISTVSFTSTDGTTWTFGGVIANWSSVSSPAFGSGPIMWGPSESDLVLLSDNRTLMSVVRMDGDGGCFDGTVPPADRHANTTTYRNYAASYSTDGATWTFPAPIPGTGCARPRVQRFADGTVILTGGRLCVENTTGIFLWVNPDRGTRRSIEGGGTGTATVTPGGAWERHSITAQHNRLWKGDPTLLFSDAVNDSSVFETLSYTSIMVTGPRSAAIAYNQFFYKDYGPNHTVKTWPGPNANFVIHVALQ